LRGGWGRGGELRTVRKAREQEPESFWVAQEAERAHRTATYDRLCRAQRREETRTRKRRDEGGSGTPAGIVGVLPDQLEVARVTLRGVKSSAQRGKSGRTCLPSDLSARARARYGKSGR
jgi:hypothetical protein